MAPRGIVKSCGSSALGDHAATSPTSSGRSTITPLSKRAPARTSATRWGPLTARQRSWAASSSLNAIASPAALEPGPLVTLVLSRTVEKGGLDRVAGLEVPPVLGREVEET